MSDLYELSVHCNHMGGAFSHLFEHNGDALDGLIHRYRVQKNLVDGHTFHFNLLLTLFLLNLWSGGISYVRPFFPPQARKDRVPGGPGFRRNGRVGFSFRVYTISKNALAAAKDLAAAFAAEVRRSP